MRISSISAFVIQEPPTRLDGTKPGIVLHYEEPSNSPGVRVAMHCANKCVHQDNVTKMCVCVSGDCAEGEFAVHSAGGQSPSSGFTFCPTGETASAARHTDTKNTADTLTPGGMG